MVAPGQRPEDGEADPALRPRRFEEFIGQSRVKENLRLFVAAARARGEALDHVLLHGPPGLGKTTLAYVIAAELGVGVRVTSGPAIERAGDLVAILTNLEPRDILFIDEIHRLNRQIEEVLYPAMEESAVDITIGKGPAAKSLRIPLPPFTLIGATTRAGMLTSPLRDRFGVVERLEFYDAAELEAVIIRAAGLLGISIDAAGAKEIAARSRGTPRIANRLLRRVRDYAQVRADGAITVAVAAEALALFDVDHLGLDGSDRRLLEAVAVTFDGGPVGVETLAAAIHEESATIEDVYEPFLMQLGLLQRTSRGRVVTPAAYRHLGLPPPGGPGAVERARALRTGLFDAEVG